MRLSIVLFDGFTALDVVGGYEVLQLCFEYYPAPPFGSGPPDTQPAAMQQIVARFEADGERQLAARRVPFARLIPVAESTQATPDR